MTCSKRLEATQRTCSVDLYDALRPQTYKRADIVHPICDIRACYQSERSTRLPGYAIKRPLWFPPKSTNTGRTTAWADVEGRHLLCGFVGRLQLRSPDLPRKACPHRARRPFLCPNPSVQNRWGTKAEKWYPASQLGYCPTLETPGTTKRAPIELGGGGVTTGRGAQLGAPYTSAP